jgi:hypothetical protein
MHATVSTRPEHEKDSDHQRQRISGAGIRTGDAFGEYADDLTCVGLGKLVGEACSDDLKGDLSLSDGDAGLKSGEDVHIALGALGEESGIACGDVVHPDGSVGVHFDDGVRAVELLFGDADHGDVTAIEADRAAEDFGIAAEAFLPVAISQDHDVAGLGLIAFTGEDQTADGRANAKH